MLENPLISIGFGNKYMFESLSDITASPKLLGDCSHASSKANPRECLVAVRLLTSGSYMFTTVIGQMCNIVRWSHIITSLKKYQEDTT